MQPIRILIVDDDPDMCRLLARAVSKRGRFGLSSRVLFANPSEGADHVVVS